MLSAIAPGPNAATISAAAPTVQATVIVVYR
jgi:hypothetical protein